MAAQRPPASRGYPLPMATNLEMVKAIAEKVPAMVMTLLICSVVCAGAGRCRLNARQ